jgi:hypothetical protein
LVVAETGALQAKRYLIIDRDTKYTLRFQHLIDSSRARVIRLSPLLSNLNAYAARFLRSIKDECLDRMIFVGQASLRRAVDEYMTHCHAERNHQGPENRTLGIPQSQVPQNVEVANFGCAAGVGPGADMRERRY